MASTFFGLSIASSGLNAYQAAINTTANNISNVETKGYSKQTINLVASSALRAYQSYGTTGTGVIADSVTQLRDQYYDEKYWNNQSDLGLYDKKLYYMDQIESIFTDDKSTTGFSTIYGKMFSALDALKTNAADSSYRNEFVSKAQELATYFNSVATQLSEVQSSTNDEIKTTVDNINAISQKIAMLNKQINTIEIESGHANELRDQRALLVDELSKIVPVEVRETEVTNTNDPEMQTGATYYTVKVDGVTLVDTYTFNTLSCVGREEKYNQSDIDGLYNVIWNQSGATFDTTKSTMSGSLKALFEIRDGNNSENLTGKVLAVGNNTIKITNPSITTIEKMNLPEEGQITLNNTNYTYNNFSVETDADGNVTSYTFVLDKALTAEDKGNLMGKSLVVGKSVDYMGVPYYMNQMNEFLRAFTKAFNDIEHTGVDLNGNPAGSFFVGDNAFTGEEQDMTGTYQSTTYDSLANTYYRMTAANVSVADATVKDPALFSTAVSIADGTDASDLVTGLAKLQSDKEIFRGGGGDKFLQCIYSDVTVDTEQCTLFKNNYTSISTTIDNQRASVSGVDTDEEALDLVRYQNAYNLASKCISTLSEMYDRLILETGV